jgi:hypothetical protein
MIVIYVLILLIPVVVQYKSFPFYRFSIEEPQKVSRKKIKKKGVMFKASSKKKRRSRR